MDISYKTLPALAAYIDRIGAEQLNIRRFMVKQYIGKYYHERVLIKIANDGTISASDKDYAPTEEEVEAIKLAINSVNFPRTIPAEISQLPALLRKFRPESSHFEFLNHEGKISMVQERALIKGEKMYLPWTFFSDGEWRMMEPDGPLPFWKPHAVATKPRIMVHEGAKAAAAAHDIVKDVHSQHPWRDFLSSYEHWGMIGGALAPQRSNYEEIRREKPLEVIYVCDNDDQGKSAAQTVSRYYRGAMKAMFFGAEFKEGWDMADEIPKTFFAENGRYIGVNPKHMLVVATWATELVPGTKSQYKISREFSKEWWHTIQPEFFFHPDRPNELYIESQFNSKVRPYSDVDNTARLLRAEQKSKACVLRYNPAEKPGIFTSKDGSFVNIHTPSEVKPDKKGSPAPWLNFMEHLIPDDKDRHEVFRWVATLIARPDVKMHYGMLLISETQGVGKGTLCDGILKPIIGDHNVSHPSEDTIVNSNFNTWIAQKRLAVVHEIYAGHSAKAYNKMKSVTTDDVIEVNQKYTQEYTLQNWLHVIACSNSPNALRLSIDDRRWLVPKVAEEKPPVSFWTEIYRWLKDDNGLGVIINWAVEFLKEHPYVRTGELAPWTSHKKEVIEESYSPGMAAVKEICQRLVAILEGQYPDEFRKLEERGMIKNGQSFIRDIDLLNMIKDLHQSGNKSMGQYVERPATIRKVARTEGLHAGSRTLIRKIDGERFTPLFTSKELAGRPMNEVLDELGLEPIDLSVIRKL